MNFREFLLEAQEKEEGKKLKHLTHVEDNVIHNGHEGAAVAEKHLLGMHNKLLGKSVSDIHDSTKFDGAPSVVFGVHPKTGQPFVASKSAFNKNPKINYTDEDIERNHGHAPGLVTKLKAALHHLPNILPHEGGVYQGDIMHTEGDAKSNKGHTSITPNTITYSAPSNSPEGRNLKKKFGIVVHTKYKGKGDLQSMSAEPLDDKTRSKFRDHPDVNNINPKSDINPSNYTAEEQKAFLQHMENARRAYAAMKPEGMDALKGHGINLEAHINDMIRKGGSPSTQGYIDHLTGRHNKKVGELKTQAARDKYSQQHASEAGHIMKNKEHFNKALQLHNHLRQAKNVLIGVLNKNNRYQHTINGQPTGSEGAVVFDKQGNASKLVDRDSPISFAKMNLTGAGKFQKSSEPKKKTIWWGRGQPVSRGHEQGINMAQKDGDHEIIFSHTHDDKNPLTPEQKVKHAKAAFPGANIKTSSKDEPSILHHASRISKEGVKHLKVIAGADRVDQYKKLLNDYNNKEGKHGHYNFDKIEVVSAGERDGKSGLSSVSGTKMREAAAQGDRKAFHAMAPSGMNEKQKDAMMKDVQAGLKATAKKPKKLKEETQSAGEAVRGFGDVSGNPAVQDDPLQQYISTNQLAKDNENGALMKMMKDSKHDILGFKAFEPKELEKFKKGKK